jgi:hypothetical protein
MLRCLHWTGTLADVVGTVLVRLASVDERHAGTTAPMKISSRLGRSGVEVIAPPPGIDETDEDDPRDERMRRRKNTTRRPARIGPWTVCLVLPGASVMSNA